MNDMENRIPEGEKEATRAVPALADAQASPRRRRSDRYRAEDAGGAEEAERLSAEVPAAARYAGQPATRSGSETAREVARRFRMEEMDGSALRNDVRAARGGEAAGERRSLYPGREQTGYAPGRMGMGGMARGRMSEESRARLAAENRGMAGDGAAVGYGSRREDGTAGRSGAARGNRASAPAPYEEERPEGRRRILIPAALTVLALAVGAVLLLLLAVPVDAGGPLGALRQRLTGRAPEAVRTVQIPVFTVDGAEGSAPADVVFTIAVEGAAPTLRLVDEAGNEIPAERVDAEGTAPNFQTLRWDLGEAWEGTVKLQALVGETWQDTGRQADIRITGAARPETTATPESVVFTVEETEIPFEEDDSWDAEQEGTNERDSGSPAAVVLEKTAPATEIPIVTDAPADSSAEPGGASAAEKTENRAETQETEDTENRAETTAGQNAANAAEALPAEASAETPDEAPEEEAEAWEEIPDPNGADIDEDDPERFAAEAEPAPEEEDASPDGSAEQAPEDGAQTPTDEQGQTGTAEAVSGADPSSGEQAPEDAQGDGAEAARERPILTVAAAESADPGLIATAQIYNGTKKVKQYARASADQIQMPAVGEYTRQKMGILTFRTDAFRQNAAIGTAEGLNTLELAWTAEAGSAKGASGTMYYGSGWGSQPAIIKWSKEVREQSDLYESKKEKTGLREVIVAGQDGRIFFLDLSDGTATRNSIKLGYPMRGAPSLHPSGAPYMTVGQLARKMARGTGTIGLRQYNLYNMKEMSLIDGLDAKNNRPFNNIGSFETSALIDRKTGTLVTAGTNGLLYVIKLNSEFDYAAGVYRQSPAQVVLRTKAKKEKDAETAVEASVAMYDRYVYYADMGGYLRCVDTNSMTVAWAVALGGAVESTPALDWHGEDGLDLYAATELTVKKKGEAEIKCFDALSGEVRWSTGVEVTRDTKSKTKPVAGFRASPVVGQNSLSEYVYYTVNRLSDAGQEALNVSEAAALIALRKDDGRIVWARGLTGNGYSSPVAVYTALGEGVILQCCGDGTILMLDGLTGEERARLEIDGAIEASPAVYNNMMVIATSEKNRNNIYGIRIK